MRRMFTKNPSESNVDLTPMLDIVFIMLIFFIVTTSFVKESAVNLARPTPSDSKPVSQKLNVFIMINEANRITMKGLDVDIRAVRARVEQVKAQNPSAFASIGVHVDSNTDTLIQVVNAAREAGIETISVSELN